MAVVWIRTYGSLSSHALKEGIGRGDGAPVVLRGKRVKVREVLSKLHIPEEAVSFVAINGVKAAQDVWVTDGDNDIDKRVGR